MAAGFDLHAQVKQARWKWEAAPCPIAVISHDRDPKDRKFVYVNTAFTLVTGYAKDEVIGQPAKLLDGPKIYADVSHECEKCLARGEEFALDLVHCRKDGSEYACRVSIAPLIEPDESEQFLVMTEVPFHPLNELALAEEAMLHEATVPLTLPMPLKEFPDGRPPPHLQSHPELDRLRAVWTEIRGNRTLPSRADFDLARVKRWAPFMSIATVLYDGRLQFRLFGTELTRVYGRDLTGCFLDELVPRDLWSVIMMHYLEAVVTRKPVFAPITIANGRWYTEVSRLLLPLARGGDDVAYVMAADYVRTNI